MSDRDRLRRDLLTTPGFGRPSGLHSLVLRHIVHALHVVLHALHVVGGLRPRAAVKENSSTPVSAQST